MRRLAVTTLSVSRPRLTLALGRTHHASTPGARYSTINERATDTTLSLKIANPASLLNNISHRYASTSRIVMEFIDNPLDDAEAMFRENHGAYPHAIKITVTIDLKAKSLRVVDNCRGMTIKELQQLVERVGESSKKAAETLTVRTKKSGGDMYEMKVQRDQIEGIHAPMRVENTLPSDHGTEIILQKFDNEWWKDISLESLSGEIEQHFERLLARPKLILKVEEVAQGQTVRSVVCRPFDYKSVPGVRISKVLRVPSGREEFKVPVELVVAESDEVTHKARFFALGRRINEISLVSSFMKLSQFKKSLWSHPQLIGYIDVDSVLEPVITRDEFKRSAARTALYKQLLDMEGEIKSALDVELDKQRVVSMGRLEGVLDNVLDKIVKEDKREEQRRKRVQREMIKAALAQNEPVRPSPDAEEEAAEPYREIVQEEPESERVEEEAEQEQSKGKTEEKYQEPQKADPSAVEAPTSAQPELQNDSAKHRVSGMKVHFVAIPPNEHGAIPRSHVVDDTIHINTLHPDFIARIRSRMGRPIITERLGAYLGAVISAHYHEHRYITKSLEPSIAAAFEDLITTTNRIEMILRRKLPSLQRSMSKVMPQNVVDALQVESASEEVFSGDEDYDE